ncbi:MAG: CorA family divalent cation transporter [Cyanobacteriota bacterium]
MKIPPAWRLPPSIQNRFGERSVGKQRAMLADGHLLLVLHNAPEAGEQTRIGVLFWRQPNGIWEHSGGGIGLQPLLRHLEKYNTAEEKLQIAYRQAESAEDYFQLLEAIAPLRLSAKNMHATLQAAREGVPDDRDLIDLRDWAYEIDRSLDLLYENTKNALDYQIAQRAEEQNRLTTEALIAGHRLNILAAVFLPLTAIASIFGMNLNSGIDGSSTFTFWLVAVGAIALGSLVRRWVVAGRWF